MTNMFKPEIKQPAKAPEPPKIEAPRRQIGGESEAERSQSSKRKGRSALRIDPQTGGVPAKRTGLNVPVK